ncbi:MAG: response regulator [Pseudomonadota bacterium]|nr:response regulator [Pseudomonadota bacterium]
MLASLAALLRQDGYNVLLAASAPEAFDLLALHEVQVVMCDQLVPGAHFFESVKAMYPATFRIALSARADLDAIMQAINRGAINRFYTKPWDDSALRTNVREAFRQHAMLCH